ncbi:uncharacterized protein LOC136028184 isoform X2 [Artemia franciscana]
MPDKALADYQTDVQTVSFQIGGKRPRGFVFTAEKADFSDLSLHSELNFEGLQPKERMVILEVARQDAEFWAHLHKSSQPRKDSSNNLVTSGNSLNRTVPDIKGISLKEEIRIHLKSFVSNLLGQRVDEASVADLRTESIFIEYYRTYHPPITHSLSRLSLSVLTSCLGQPLPTEGLPTTAHSLAKAIIHEALEAAKKLPFSAMKESNLIGSGNPSYFPGLSDSYEGLLANVVLSTAFERAMESKKEFGIQTDAPSVIFKSGKVDTAVQSNLSFSDSDDGISPGSSMTNPTIMTEDTDTFTYYQPDDRLLQGDITLTEEVEELVTCVEDDPSKRHNSIGTLDKFLSSLNDCFKDPGIVRTPFPEMGVDIVDGDCDMLEPLLPDMDISSLLEKRTAIDNWEENWLFRNKKDVIPSVSNLIDTSFLTDEPIGMYVPLPVENLHPCVGDISFDQISELSEKSSYGSLEFSSTDSEEECKDPQTAIVETALDSLEQRERESTEQYASISFRVVSPLPSEPFSEEKDENGLRIPVYLHAKARCCVKEGNLKFLVKPGNCTVSLGRCLRVSCLPAGRVNVGVAWFKNSRRLQFTEDVFQTENHGTRTLHIYDASSDHSGLYSVVIYDDQYQCWTDFSIRVTGRPIPAILPSLKVFTDLFQVVEGQDAIIRGEVYGHPEPLLTLKEKPFEDNTSLDQETSGSWTVVIRRVIEKNSGKYIVTASNRLGSVSTSFELQIRKKSEQAPSKSTVNESVPPIPKKRLKVPRAVPAPRLKKKVAEEESSNPQTIETRSVPSIDSENLTQTLRPGSIAEREYKKWSQAVPMPNNPYSAEKLQQRLESRFDAAATRFYVGPKQSHLESNDDHQCDWLESYRRDYIITGNSEGKRKSECQNSAVSLPLKKQDNPVSITKSIASDVSKRCGPSKLEKGCTILNESSKDKPVPISCQSVDKLAEEKLVKNFENERSKCKENSDDDEGIASNEEVPVLPSVKKLASLFKHTAETNEVNFQEKGKASKANESTGKHVAGVISGNSQNVQNKVKNLKDEEVGVFRIHSLTARNVPREFRKGLELNRDRPQDKIVKLLSPSRANDNAKVTIPAKQSESKGAASTKGVKSGIAKRAAFWDNRIVNGIVEDAEVSDNFPELL